MLRLLVSRAGARPVANAVQVERQRAANARPEGPQVGHAGRVLQQQVKKIIEWRESESQLLCRVNEAGDREKSEKGSWSGIDGQ